MIKGGVIYGGKNRTKWRQMVGKMQGMLICGKISIWLKTYEVWL